MRALRSRFPELRLLLLQGMKRQGHSRPLWTCPSSLPLLPRRRGKWHGSNMWPDHAMLSVHPRWGCRMHWRVWGMVRPRGAIRLPSSPIGTI